MRIPIRTSRLAIWSRRIGAFAVPLLLIATALRFLDIIDSAAFEIVLVITTGLGALAVLCAVIAFGRIWYTGDLGWGRASFGMLAGLIALGPLGYAAVFAFTYPSTSDITTRPDDPPALALRRDDDAATPLDSGALARAFPEVVTRTYPVEPAQLYALAEGLVEVRGWATLRRTGPVANAGTGVLNVVQTTPFGWENELALVIGPAGEGARIDMRAASVRGAVHDLGVNGRLASAFLADLDAVVGVFERDGLALIEEAREAPQTPAVDVGG